MDIDEADDLADQAYVAGQLDMRQWVDQALQEAGLYLDMEGHSTGSEFVFKHVVCIDDPEKAKEWFDKETSR